MSQNRILTALGVSKGSLYYKRRGYPKNRDSKSADHTRAVQVLTEIAIARPTYGCPRLRAIARRDYGLHLTAYRVYRTAKEQGLLIKANRTRKTWREHTGKVMVEKPNLRWASDITEIRLWDKTRLRFTYVLDCCDRSVIAWKLAHRIWGVDIELMVQDALLNRFGTAAAPYELEFLHDNGPEYVEKRFQASLKSWNIQDCRTPTYSPQSNGICESFNGTFKRDYVYQNCLETESEVRKMIENAVRDYNTFAPHSALGMQTPMDYFKLKVAA